MLFYKFFEILLPCIAFFILRGVSCQRIRYESSEAYGGPRPYSSKSTCSAGAVCIPVYRCRGLRNQNQLETCRFGHGRYRTVCCPFPIQSSREQVPRTYSRTPLRAPVPELPADSNAACGQGRSDNRQSLPGEAYQVQEGDWPWMVALRRRESSGNYIPWCSGFLIDTRHVLSAAKCFDNRDVGVYRARIGNVDPEEADEYSIVRISIPEGYEPGSFYDNIALLTLDREVNFPNFNPVCLPDADLIRKNLSDYGASTAGWELKKSKDRTGITLKEFQQLRIISNEECELLLQRRIGSIQQQFPRGINSGLLCTQQPEDARTGNCIGDSGSPLMFRERGRWFAIGILIFGHICDLSGIPEGYTSISNYLDWIRENTRD